MLQLELSQLLHDSASNNINDITLDIFPQIINPWEVSKVIEWDKGESGKLENYARSLNINHILRGMEQTRG